MQSVGTKDTGPELIVRKILSGAGYRYRLHVKRLPGKPDIVFIGRKKAIFVHGCFWHSHGCLKGQAPKSRLDYWEPKLEANRARDERNRSDLESNGWSVLTIWQCQTRWPEEVRQQLIAFLEDDS